MGCWNETCMISHLPILGGEKCTAVILLKREFPNVGFNAVNEYIPIATIHGEYDGYGCLENIDHAEASALLSAIPSLQLMVPAPNGCVMLTGYIPSTPEDFMKTAVSGDLLANDNRGPHIPLHIVFIKERMASLADTRNDTDLLDAAFAKDAKLPLCVLVNTLAGNCDYTILPKFIEAYISAGKEVACKSIEQILALTQLLNNLRLGWHVPCGRGSQRSVCEDIRRFADAYRVELESIDMHSDVGE